MRRIDADALMKEMDYRFRHIGRAEEVRDMINNLPTLESAPVWTPCSEGLPTKDGRYLTTWWWENNDDVSVSAQKWIDGEWLVARHVTVIAWQPLPEPYNPNKAQEA